LVNIKEWSCANEIKKGGGHCRSRKIMKNEGILAG
jgi:hypothetical protein